MIRFGAETLSVFSRGIEKEWIVTNGLGGFASSTVIGANTRRYHGLLIAALNPPTDRRLFLAKLEEEVAVEGSRQVYSLGTNKYTGAVHPEGHKYLIEFRMDLFPSFIYKFGGTILEKRIFMPHGENTTIISYHVIRSDRALTLKAIPLINARDYHHTLREAPWPFEQKVTNDPAGSEVKVEAYPGAPILTMWGAGASYTVTGVWYRSMEYLVEKRRGLDCVEDHYNPGFFTRRLEQGDTFNVIATVEDLYEWDISLLIEREERRHSELLEKAGFEDPLARRLTVAADQFVVLRKATGTRTIIAGYPWFTDWGRDTMISIPGLTLVTRRFDDAGEILWTFAKFSEKGLIPNRFPDAGERPEYNTADAPLWFFYAVYKYLQYTGDFGFVLRNLYHVMADIILHYRKGTFFNIGMDKDFLIRAGDRGTQLTWMDAKMGDLCFTPRDGKAVEINALWYNSLRIMEMLAARCKGDERSAGEYGELADRVRESFLKRFWNEREGCLYDVINDEKNEIGNEVRPNQIFAVSLPYMLLPGDKARMVVDKVFKDLYIGPGIRSLSPNDPDYIGCYQGDQFHRDSAYHQGTAWSWLVGHFVTAYMKAYGRTPETRRIARYLLGPLEIHLNDAGVGSVSEIFEGSPPFAPRGCIAQAWGVAEFLRSYVEDVLGVGPDELDEGSG